MRESQAALAAVVVLSLGLAPAAADLPEAAATVNGISVPTARLTDLLVQSYGKNMLEQLIALELVKQAAAKRGITVTEKDFQDELERTAKQGGFSKDMGDLKKLLAQYGREKGFSWAEFELTIQRNAYLRKIIEPTFTLSEAALKVAYQRQYAEKVEVRMIRSRDVVAVFRAKRRISEGESFEKVAKEISTDPSAARGGKLPAFGRGAYSGAMKAFENTAFGLREAGELSSPVGASGFFYLIQLIRRIEPPGQSFQEVREKLTKQLYPRVLLRTMLVYMKQLRTVLGKVTIHIPALKNKPAQPADEVRPK